MPSARIRYFSGTGNTRRAVDAMAAAMAAGGWSVELLAIEGGGGAARGPVDLELLAFPTLAWGPPAFVRRHVRSLPRAAGASAAVFATWGGDAMGGVERAARELERRGYEVVATGGALYPSNWRQMEDGPSAAESSALVERGDAAARAFADALVSGAEPRLPRPRASASWTAVVQPLFRLFGRRVLGKLFVADVKCTGCGLCARTCPAGAIAMRDSGGKPRPRWSFSCENCNRCINFCPARAIQSSGFRTAYHGITLAALTAASFAGAGAAAGAAAGGGGFARAAAWLAGFAVCTAAALWLQFGPLDALAFRIEGARNGALRETGYSKSFRRYLAEGFDPAKER